MHVVCTNRVALFQAMQEDASNDHEQSRQLWRYKALPRERLEADTKDAAGLRRHCRWCARIEWHCFSDSSAGPPCDVHIMIMYVVGRIGVERRCGALLVGYDVCHHPSALLGAPWYRPTRVNRGPHRQRHASLY